MEELKRMLNDVEDSYYDFITAMLHYAEKKVSRQELLAGYLKENPGVKSAEVIAFVSAQEDFYEDAARVKVG